MDEPVELVVEVKEKEAKSKKKKERKKHKKKHKKETEQPPQDEQIDVRARILMCIEKTFQLVLITLRNNVVRAFMR